MSAKDKPRLFLVLPILVLIFTVLIHIFGLGRINSTTAQLAATLSNQTDAWVTETSPTTNDLYSVDMVSEANGWAVGNEGTILYWNGNMWAIAASPTTNSLHSVTLLSEADGWAVGWNGTILHWNGILWEAVASPTTTTLWSVTMVSATDGWAVGNNGTILRWNGNIWTMVPSPTTGQLFAVEMVSSTDGWIAGYADNHGTLLRWNGTSWSTVPIPATPRLFSLSMISATDGWVVGENGWILHWDGSSWGFDYRTNLEQERLINEGVIWLNSIVALSDSDAWTVGGYIDSSSIFHWDGDVWTLSPNPATNWLQDITMVSSTNGWAVGYEGNIIHYVTPSLVINYPNGQPGSFFTITGTNFLPNSYAAIEINGYTLTETLAVDDTGGFVFLLDSGMADPGRYFVTVTTDSSVTVDFLLDLNAPLRPQEGKGAVFNVPGGIAFTKYAHLPFIQK